MAFASTTEWDVRTTGSDSNGGGFNTATAGTDYSQQDSPQITYTDLVIDATTNTKCTSAGHPFTSAHVGNIINITSGTGFTVQRVQVSSVTSGVATCDKSLGTLSSTGGNGVLGGALATIPTVNSLMVSGNTVHIKAGTYTLTSLVQMADISLPVAMIGYQTTHRDFGTRPLITTATNSTTLIKTRNAFQVSYSFININFSNTASIKGDGVDELGGGPLCVIRCMFDGFSSAIDSPGGASFTNYLFLDEVEVKNCTGAYAVSVRNPSSDGNLFMTNCNIHNNANIGVAARGSKLISVVGTLITNNGGDGFVQTIGDNQSIVESFQSCTISNNGGDGIQVDGGGGGDLGPAIVSLKNCIIYGNGGYGINCPVGVSVNLSNRNNAYGSNTLGARLNFPVGGSDVSLTADPFTNSAGGDYSLNSTAGGGALCRGGGFQWGV